MASTRWPTTLNVGLDGGSLRFRPLGSSSRLCAVTRGTWSSLPGLSGGETLRRLDSAIAPRQPGPASAGSRGSAPQPSLPSSKPPKSLALSRRGNTGAQCATGAKVSTGRIGVGHGGSSSSPCIGGGRGQEGTKGIHRRGGGHPPNCAQCERKLPGVPSGSKGAAWPKI